MTDALTTTPNTNSDTPTSGNDTPPTTPRRVGVRELRAGDVIAHEIGLAGRVEIARVTAELMPDLTFWWAVRTTGRAVIPAYEDSTFELLSDHRRPSPDAEAAAAVEPFVAPRPMRRLLELANHHRRSYRVDHSNDHFDGNPSVTLTVGWFPPGCDIQTTLYLRWHRTSAGRYRLESAAASGYLENYRRLTFTEAERLITGATCFFHGEATPPPPQQ